MEMKLAFGLQHRFPAGNDGPVLDTAISCIAIKWIFGSSLKMTLFELIGHPRRLKIRIHSDF